jgi:hypothetical protein
MIESTRIATYYRGALVALALLVGACSSVTTQQSLDESAASASYDSNSWKTMIDNDCRAFFDGCNNCRREPGKEAMCTRKACATYQQPRCLDE